MARSVAQGFEAFLENLTPLPSQREAAAKHRASVETSLKNSLDVKLFRESGSFNHGTGVRNHCDVDLMVSLGHKPGTSTTALSWIKGALSKSFPYTTVTISRPAVRVLFNGGKETWEIIPGFRKNAGDAAMYDIPGVAGVDWLEYAPTEHINYVNTVNRTTSVSGGAKKLARLAKAWKYYNNVPVSSFYLEMRAAKHMSSQSSYVAVYDVCYLFEHLDSIGLAAMNDPEGLTSRFFATSSESKLLDAKSKVHTAATRARKALDAERGGRIGEAFEWLDKLFGGRFPGRY